VLLNQLNGPIRYACKHSTTSLESQVIGYFEGIFWSNSGGPLRLVSFVAHRVRVCLVTRNVIVHLQDLEGCKLQTVQVFCRQSADGDIAVDIL